MSRRIILIISSNLRICDMGHIDHLKKVLRDLKLTWQTPHMILAHEQAIASATWVSNILSECYAKNIHVPEVKGEIIMRDVIKEISDKFKRFQVELVILVTNRKIEEVLHAVGIDTDIIYQPGEFILMDTDSGEIIYQTRKILAPA